MAKPIVLSVRSTEEMDYGLKVLASVYRQDIQDMYRLAFSEFIIKNKNLIKEHENRFIFKNFDENKWIYNKMNRFIKWEEGKYGEITGRLLEISSDGWLIEYEYLFPTSLLFVQKAINDLDLDIKLDDNGMVYDSTDEERTYEELHHNDQTIIDILCDYKGKEVKKYVYHDKSELNELLEVRYDISHRL